MRSDLIHYVTVMTALVFSWAIPAYADGHSSDLFALQSCFEEARSIGDPDVQYSCMSTIARNCDGNPQVCWQRSYKAWDRMLNDAYVNLRDIGRDAVFKKIREGQRAWITFRDADCNAAASIYAGGSFATARKAQCLSDKTALRTITLMNLIDELSL